MQLVVPNGDHTLFPFRAKPALHMVASTPQTYSPFSMSFPHFPWSSRGTPVVVVFLQPWIFLSDPYRERGLQWETLGGGEDMDNIVLKIKEVLKHLQYFMLKILQTGSKDAVEKKQGIPQNTAELHFRAVTVTDSGG